MNTPEPPIPRAADQGERLESTRRQLGRLAWLLDSSLRVPGTRFRFGLEPIIGLIPGVGDVASGGLGLYLIVRAVQFRLPGVVILRMVVNTLLDLTIGAIPVLGDLFDFAYKSNSRNMRLFDEYAADPGRSTRSEWALLGGLLLIAAGVLGLLLIGADWLLAELARVL